MMNRRRFFHVLTQSLVAIWGIVVVYPIAKYLKKPADPESQQASSVTVCGANEISAGQSKTFKFGNHPGILVCDKSGDYHAFDATCTHLGCTAQYRASNDDIFCACHGGVYDIDGKNISGPPPRPLLALKVTVENEQIVVSKG